MPKGFKLGRLLSRTWLEGAIDGYLANYREPEFGKDEPQLIHVSWLLGTEDEIYRRLMKLDPPGNPPSANLRRKFDDGNDVQTRYLRYFREMGILYEEPGWDEVRGLRRIDEKHGIIGHIDACIRVPEGIVVPVELKAYTSPLYKRYLHRPRIEHYHQLMIYIHLFGAPYGWLLPECKDDQSINPIKVVRDDEMINAALAKADAVWARVKENMDL